MKRRNKVRFFIMLTAPLLLTVLFNNCGKGKSMDDMGADSFSSLTANYNAADACSEADVDFFDKGYHQFLAKTCMNCHVSGPGIGAFAHPDKNVAFDGFNMHGYDKISQYAVSDQHNPPYTGSQNTEIINSLRLQWQTFQNDKLKCANGGSATSTPAANPITDPQFETSTQTIPALKSTTQTVKVNGADVSMTVYDRKTLTWDLSSQLTQVGGKQVPVLAGVKLSVTVTGYITPSNETAYLFTMPTLKVGSSSVRVQGLNLRLNGFPISYATTFTKIDKNVYQNTTGLLSPGSMVSVGPFGASDTLSVLLGDIELVDIPAPPPPPSVQFSVTSMTVQQSDLGSGKRVTITVQVIGDNFDPISVPVSFAAANAYANGEVPAIGIKSSSGKNRFDWDYKVDPTTPMSLNINARQASATFNLIFSDDLRYDADKVLRLTLGTPFGAVLGTNTTLRISLPNYNPTYAGSAPTFAQLMDPKSGVLGVNCVKCHNSVDMQGGYDMTDYQGMVAKGVLAPGDPAASHHKMFRRMNADDPNLAGLQSMPLDGFLPRDQVQLVNDWIAAGAQNN